MSNFKICCMTKCNRHGDKVTLRHGKYFCDAHHDNALQCLHCKCYMDNVIERKTPKGNKDLCNKCDGRFKFVNYTYKVCCYGIGDTCSSPQEKNSIFCENHSHIEICDLCNQYRTKDDVEKYKKIGKKNFCGQCIEKLTDTHLIDEHKDDKRVQRKLKKLIQKRKKNIQTSKKQKIKKQQEKDLDSEADDSEEDVEPDELGSEFDSEAEREAQEDDKHPNSAVDDDLDDKSDSGSESE